jgi:hypothetical protein
MRYGRQTEIERERERERQRLAEAIASGVCTPGVHPIKATAYLHETKQPYWDGVLELCR